MEAVVRKQDGTVLSVSPDMHKQRQTVIVSQVP